MTGAVLTSDRWQQRRRRAGELQDRYEFAAEVLAFYAKLLELQETAYNAVLEQFPQPAEVAQYATKRVLPRVIELSAQSGPSYLMQAVLERFHEADFEVVFERWLRGERLSGVDRYLARASTAPVLEALGPAAAQSCQGQHDDCHCSVCGGLPQLSYFGASSEDLVTAHRYLECSRCAHAWAFARMTCAFCGETDPSRLQIFDEIGTPRFPHVRIDGCDACSRYLLNIDVGRERQGVPVVDEIAAIPLDLYAKERGLHKIVPNVMGF